MGRKCPWDKDGDPRCRVTIKTSRRVTNGDLLRANVLKDFFFFLNGDLKARVVSSQIPDRKNISRENQASLTQQISHYCAAQWAALHTHSNQTPSTCTKRARWRLKLSWSRGRLTGEKGWGGTDARGWVWKRPCIRRITYWSTGGEQPCALSASVDIRVDVDV